MRVNELLRRDWLRRGWAVLVLAAAACGQASLGDPAPTAAWSFAQGDAIAFGEASAPECSVFAFYTQPAHTTELAGGGHYFAELQRRYLERGLAVVAVVTDAKAAPLENWAGCRVAVDADSQTTLRWLTDGGTPWHVVMVDKEGKVVFLGGPEAGLVDAIERAVGGKSDIAAEQRAFAWREELPQVFDDATVDVLTNLTTLVQHAPRDGLSQGLLYLTQATKANDAKAAGEVLRAAIGHLGTESRPLACFADLALRGDPRRAGLATTLRPVLQAAAAAAPADVALQLTYLRALVLAGDDREVGRQSMRIRKVVTATAAHCIDFAAILTGAGNAPAHLDLATMALTKAATLSPDPRELAAARYAVATRCANDAEAGKKLRDEYLADVLQVEARVSINNDCWYLMTQLPTMGRFDAFAAALAERMLDEKDAMDYFELDTAALAMFLVGRFAEAVSLQEAAIEKGGKGNPEYTERLQRYKVALPQPPR
jgi:hypothetical protein